LQVSRFDNLLEKLVAGFVGVNDDVEVARIDMLCHVLKVYHTLYFFFKQRFEIGYCMIEYMLSLLPLSFFHTLGHMVNVDSL
jgi:hypothetical protein